MNYNEVFANLKTNNKYSRKSPHKAVLLLAIINLYEKGVLTENDIRYSNTLINEFRTVWNTILVDEQCFHPEMFYPFWFMQSEDFWHVVLNTGYDSEYRRMIEERIKPTENKVITFINHVELDHDLYFLLTFDSGRKSLRQSLLATFEYIPQSIIDKILYSSVAIESEKMETFNIEPICKEGTKVSVGKVSSAANEMAFTSLDEDLQYAINIVYYTYLKQHRSERELIKDLVPSAADLYVQLTNKQSMARELSLYSREMYINFLCEIRALLMGEDNAMEIVDLINNVIQKVGNDEDTQDTEHEAVFNEFDRVKKELDKQFEAVNISSTKELTAQSPTMDVNTQVLTEKENRRGKLWTEAEKELCQKLFQSGYDFSEIAMELGRTEVAIKIRLASMGLIDYTYESPDPKVFSTLESSPSQTSLPSGIKVKNEDGYGKIINIYDETIFSEKGFLKELQGHIYRFNLKYECFTVKEIGYRDSRWIKSGKLLVAFRNSDLYRAVINSYGYISHVKSFVSYPDIRKNVIKFDDQWYDFDGKIINE